MEKYRRIYVSCDCPRHKGEMVHYKRHQRCLSRMEGDDVKQDLHVSDDSSDDLDISDVDDDREQCFKIEDDIDRLCFEIFANHVDSNTTQESVTQHLTTIRATLGAYLPRDKRERIPKNFHSLRTIFEPHMVRLIRLPVCPGECQLLENVTPTVNYTCWCDGKKNTAWR